MKLEDLHSVYFIGIGGIGMSAIARYLHSRGVRVAGYDRSCTALTRKLEAEGMKIHYEDRPDLLPQDTELVVYTPAVPDSLQELQQVRNSGLTLMKRSEVLGLISRGHKTLAVAGTHGKTTTSTMLTWLLAHAGMEPVAFLGGIGLNWQSNYVPGTGEWAVMEADEYDRSFLRLSPEMAAILSVDPDHLDVYGDPGSMWESGFLAFAKSLPPGRTLFLPERLRSLFEGRLSGQEVISFGIGEGDYRAENLRVENGRFVFDMFLPENRRLEDLSLLMAGRHNVENAVAALAMALEAGMPLEAAAEGIATFKGIKRRFERVLEREDLVFIDDYAHHPTELKAAISAARELYPGRRITGLFQPHLYSRTRDFQRGFAEALDALDEAVLLDIYPAREEPIPGVSSELISRQMKKAGVPVLRKSEVTEYLKSHRPDVLMTLGAGDIDTLVEPIQQMFKQA
ncbi:MAG TPA: UDP-N-acetylmuramate--L-alanine ligase [Phaeodactylibacter sp.]|nr:UDP-N-acetylmuramate--L-alanine ligase [Phaeodactylibacter sp.]